jgi:hypothetical protein
MCGLFRDDSYAAESTSTIPNISTSRIISKLDIPYVFINDARINEKPQTGRVLALQSVFFIMTLIN